MHRDPAVLVILSLDTNLEVMWSAAHLFDREGVIIRTHTRHGDHDRQPFIELGWTLEWSAAQLNDFFTDLFGGQFG
jgi:hypothetical protein